MQFTAQERKLIERLRKEERLWPRLRWWVVGGGVSIEICYVYLLISMMSHIARHLSAPDELAVSALFIDILMLWPKCLLMLPVGAVLICWGIRNWRGNANRMVLLRLLDAQETADRARAA